MSTLTDSAHGATCTNGMIHVVMKSGTEFHFSADENPRLARGTPEQLANIEISPYGLHWPDLDEDLSFSGLVRGDVGQISGQA